MSDVERFVILAVCTANICRSPMIERLLAHRLAERLGEAAAHFQVGSAGVWGGRADEPVDALAAAELVQRGIAADGFLSRELTASLIAEADLVLTATREHRAVAVTVVPSAARRTFTLAEFLRLISEFDVAALPGSDPVSRAGELVRAAASRRGLSAPTLPGDDDLADPYGGPVPGFQQVAERIVTAVDVIVDSIALASR